MSPDRKEAKRKPQPRAQEQASTPATPQTNLARPENAQPGTTSKSDRAKSRQEVQRAYEHLARVTVVMTSAGEEGALVNLAQRVQRLASGGLESVEEMPEYAKVASELARAAEHIAFAAAVDQQPSLVPWSSGLEESFVREYDHLAAEAALDDEDDLEDEDDEEGEDLDDDDDELEDDDDEDEEDEGDDLEDDDEDDDLEDEDEDDLEDDDEEEEGEDVAEMIHTLKHEAEEARAGEHYARALECMRGAEALASAARHLDRIDVEEA